MLGTIPTLGFDIARFINQYQVRARAVVDLPHPHPFLSSVLGMRLYMHGIQYLVWDTTFILVLVM